MTRLTFPDGSLWKHLFGFFATESHKNNISKNVLAKRKKKDIEDFSQTMLNGPFGNPNFSYGKTEKGSA